LKSPIEGEMSMKFSLLAIFLLGGVFSHTVLAEVAMPRAVELAASDTNNPYNSPVRRINPNSRQGTTAPNPQLRQPTRQVDNPRPPTLENRGIGNGENLRRPASGTQQPRTAPGTR
jgi:hypothetical protein